MSHEVVVYLGPARCGKTHSLLRQYRDALRGGPAGRLDAALWIAPTSRTAAAVRESLVRDGLSACLGPGVVTFDDCAALILATGPAKLHRTTPAMERDLVRQTIHAAVERGSLAVYDDAARREGFVDLVLEHIRELRRRGVTSDRFAQLRPNFGNPHGHAELAALYATYQQLVDDNQLIDSEGAPWAACDLLEAGGCSRYQQFSVVVADGFTDFTAAQHKLLNLLAARARQLLISLTWEAAPAPQRSGHFSDQLNRNDADECFPRSDLFAKTAATLAELRRQHPQLVEQHFAPRPSNWPAHDHLVGHIFRHPSHIPQPAADVLDSLQHIEIIETAGAHDEIVQIARRIKRLLIQQRESTSTVRPSDIVVVLRSLAEAAPRIREVFSQFGIPYSLEIGPRLVSTAFVKTLLALLQLDADDWPFRRTVSILANNTLTAVDASARRAADWLIRDLQIAKGRGALLERVQQLAADPSPLDSLGERARRRVLAAKAAFPAFQLLSHALDNLPAEATPSEWADALARLGTSLGLPPFTDPISPGRSGHFSDQLQSDDPNHDASDALAWRCIVEHLASLERSDAWLHRRPRKLSRRGVFTALLDVATHQALPGQHDDVGRVRVLTAPTARTISARHLFLAGMSEQAFPAPERAGRLGTEADYRFFSRAANQAAPAAQAPPAPSRAHEEMLLFYEVLSRAEESLTISYPALDDKAQTLPPSPYVVEIQRVMRVGTEQLPIHMSRPQLSPVPQSDRPFSVADWRIQAVDKSLRKDGNLGLLAGIFRCQSAQPLGAAIDAGLRIVHERARRESYGAAEGLLTSPAAAARFAERFGPQHLWSPSQWETYAACPYKFFLESVLGLEPLGDLVLETDHMRRGSRLHQVLAEFHRRWPAARGDRALAADEEAALFFDELQKVLDERMPVTPRAGVDAALLELDRRQILEWAKGHFQHHTRYGDLWSKLGGQFTPTHFELRFGPPRPGDDESEDPESRNNTFELDIHGEKVLVTGRIDRIDVAQIDEKTVFNVIDYKSGRRSSLKEEHIASGEHLQLPIYVAAAQALVFDGNAQPIAAGYWTMAGGFDSKGVLAVQQADQGDDRWTKLHDVVKQRVGQFIKAIRHGDFPVASSDDQCTSRCEFNTVCRITQIRNLNKTWPPLAPSP